MGDIVYKRVLIKFSGEVFAGEEKSGIDYHTILNIARELQECHRAGVQIGIVNGGGNLFRGLSEKGRRFDRVVSDHIGMLATVMNGLALKDALAQVGVPGEVFSAIEMERVARNLIVRDVRKSLEEGKVVILCGGTGNPYFSTDSAAALRAAEIKADLLIKGTKVDGVYEKDPVKYPGAKKFDFLTYDEALEKQLRIMDLTAFTLCKENRIPIIVYNMKKNGYLSKLLKGEKIGTKVSER